MKKIVRWTIDNTPAMNTMMIAIIIVGTISLLRMRRELFPEFDLEIVIIQVPYPGASPEEVEEGICQKIEEAVRSVDGIKKMTSIAAEGSGSVILELVSDIPDVQKTLNEVKNEVDRIISFPDLAEDPEVRQFTLREPAIRVGILGPEDDSPEAQIVLRNLAERVRDDISKLPDVSMAELIGVRDYQIDIEISEETLRKYNLTLEGVAKIVREENLELPGGTIRTPSQEILVRGKGKKLIGTEIAQIPLVTLPNGVVLTVGDLGTVRDEFVDIASEHEVNGRPALVVEVQKTSREDLLAITKEVHEYVKNRRMPSGYELKTWADVSTDVRDRIELLTRNGIQGMILVFFVLAIFLEIRLAGWVAIGVPIAMAGACAVLFYTGQTLNMISMFAFLMALGILVDDAIVVGENVYDHRQRGKKYLTAAIDGTAEVMPSVTASVTTTIIAFSPLMFLPGVIGKFIAVMPVAVIAMLLISLLEVFFILPCHLAHEPRRVTDRMSDFRDRLPDEIRGPVGALAMGLTHTIVFLLYPLWKLGGFFKYMNRQTTRGLKWTIKNVYMRILHWGFGNPLTVLAIAITILGLTIVMVRWNIIPLNPFPKMDAKRIIATVVFPDGTPEAETNAATIKMEKAIEAINREFESKDGNRLLNVVHRSVGLTASTGPAGMGQVTGSHAGSVYVELVDPSLRNITSMDIVKQWRKKTGTIPGSDQLTFTSVSGGPPGNSIEFILLAPTEKMEQLEEVADICKKQLETYEGVSDVADNTQPGKWEYQLKTKESAKSLGIPLEGPAAAARSAYYGAEVMRLQRGRHEVKLMVRYPYEERRKLADFEDLRVRLTDGAERPIKELVDVDVEQGYSTIHRRDQYRAITITADVDESIGNANDIAQDLKTNFLPKLLKKPKYEGIRTIWEGRQKDIEETVQGIIKGMIIALFLMFALLTLEFRSYFQPMLIMFIVPFGVTGAVIGHLIMGLPITFFSMFGMVALTGVVVNDAIVLIDFINHRVRAGQPLHDALLDGGSQRFRPVLLTSVTTIAGLLPLLTETSFQAQFLIPMAVSLCFGLMFTTFLILILVPTFYRIYAKLAGLEALYTAVEEPEEKTQEGYRSYIDEHPNGNGVR